MQDPQCLGLKVPELWYHKEILYSAVKEVLLPTDHFAWEQVAFLYKEQSKEAELRDVGNIRRHWTWLKFSGERERNHRKWM